ncbi:subtilisin-like protease SBT4.15 [Euphorbia lathyris]|uniref:subtilisin-like protease SBT4.15 n=1 Tax=Euphorbia lathyris TaxID=212925 RepID=UPI00331425FE
MDILSVCGVIHGFGMKIIIFIQTPMFEGLEALKRRPLRLVTSKTTENPNISGCAPILQQCRSWNLPPHPFIVGNTDDALFVYYSQAGLGDVIPDSIGRFMGGRTKTILELPLTYIVYMGDIPKSNGLLKDSHHSLLSTVIGDESLARRSKVYSYGKSFNGFVANLLPHEADKLSDNENVVSVFENTMNQLHTTRSWDFIGLTEKSQRTPKMESDVIIGMFDTGVYLDAPSFKDHGLGPPPARWKGKCVTGANFTKCNNKVIGARYYKLGYDPTNKEDLSPADDDGHGSHTASTVAGSAVKGASLYGIANGTARGGVPSARIAVYKVCWIEGCTDMDLLAGFDDAIADGVDIISASLGGDAKEFFVDPTAIGAFHAARKGILTSCSGGNSGPSVFTVQNVAPWILTVAASRTDRQFRTALKLGNGMHAQGISINTFSPSKKMFPLTNGAHAYNKSSFDYGNVSACDHGTLSMDKVKGKIVYCMGSGNQDYVIKLLKGAGAIMSYTEEPDTAFTTLIPATHVSFKDGHKIDKYINSTKKPQAIVYKTKAVPVLAPVVASFSSRGPQSIAQNILKPDLTAPGVDILAGYSKLTTITGDPSDNRHDYFNIISGTSMACPHATAAAAYVKSFHPDWSPAAVKSALMTTATPMNIKDEYAELGYGSGQINPTSAVHPGLVYDISISSYLRFLCKEGYNSTTLGKLMGGKQRFSCSDFKPAEGTDGLNYPSMHTQINATSSKFTAVFHRRVTEVGYGNSVYKASVDSHKHLSIKVIPDTLNFTALHQKKDFKVIVKGGPLPTGTNVVSAMLQWSDSRHFVKTPIVIYKSLYA